MTTSLTPTERLALSVANAALLESPNSFCDMAATIVSALADRQLLQSPDTAAELAALRARVAELEAERAAEAHPYGDPIAYGPTGIRCGCGKDAHSNLVPCRPDSPEDAHESIPRFSANEIARWQARQAEDPHDSPLHHDYAIPHDLPAFPHQQDRRAI